VSDCKRCGGTGKVGMAVANPFGSHDYETYECPECHPNEIETLRAEVERLKTELADTKRVYGTKDSTNEQKWEMLEKHCEVLEGAIRGWIEDIHRDRTPEGLDTLRYSMRKAVGQ
jgi:formate-dependent nitrite reductase cytochrome c552 subunit